MNRAEKVMELGQFTDTLQALAEVRAGALGLRVTLDCWAFDLDRATMDELPGKERHHHPGTDKEFWTKQVGRLTVYCHEVPVEQEAVC